LKAIQQPNVELIYEAAVKITANSIIGANGTEAKGIDTIICATGFDTSFRPSFPIIGRHGVNLQDKWSKTPEGYLGLTVSALFPTHYAICSALISLRVCLSVFKFLIFFHSSVEPLLDPPVSVIMTFFRCQLAKLLFIGPQNAQFLHLHWS